MPEFAAKSKTSEHILTTRPRIASRHVTILAMCVSVIAVLGVVMARAYTKDKYALKSPSGIAFSDFRGYETGLSYLLPGPMKS